MLTVPPLVILRFIATGTQSMHPVALMSSWAPVYVVAPRLARAPNTFGSTPMLTEAVVSEVGVTFWIKTPDAVFVILPSAWTLADMRAVTFEALETCTLCGLGNAEP